MPLLSHYAVQFRSSANEFVTVTVSIGDARDSGETPESVGRATLRQAYSDAALWTYVGFERLPEALRRPLLDSPSPDAPDAPGAPGAPVVRRSRLASVGSATLLVLVVVLALVALALIVAVMLLPLWFVPVEFGFFVMVGEWLLAATILGFLFSSEFSAGIMLWGWGFWGFMFVLVLTDR